MNSQTRPRSEKGNRQRFNPGGWRKEWRAFRRAPAGERFCRFHTRYRRNGWGRMWWTWVLAWSVGLLLLAAGVFFTVAPGPAVIFYFIGGALLATQSMLVARLLDSIELWILPATKWLERKWRSLSPRRRVGAKWIIIVFSTTCVAGSLWWLRR